ncbi:tetratricopeptide repeat protein [Polynucleobacter ibericus]|uniref:tetratricopeptide repeat protein n=1 Tax=Polynucleobacter ibericus TaxID=1819725 RepID=UPI001BFD0659|nr:tetratricopeptide repeat protein [Polynucleobacter ibericus]QWE08441.1 tetratricopeptide repeat protein [Polynucleobacter ibericus]
MNERLRYLLGEAVNSLRNQNSLAAELFLNQAFNIDPNCVDVLRLMGVLEAQRKDYDKALALFRRAFKNAPKNALLASNIGNVYLEQKHFKKALEFYEKAILLDRTYAEAYSNKGNALQELNRYSEAIAVYEQAIQLDPMDVKAYVNKGNAYLEGGQLESAIQSYDDAIRLQPDHYLAYWHKSLALLLSGNLDDGFLLYESRWGKGEEFEFSGVRRGFTQTLWLGTESLQGKTILIYCEQGLGDALHFARYVELVAQLGAKVILEAPKSLADVFGGLSGVSQIITKGAEIPEFDFYCPLMSLPLVFKTNLQSIPSKPTYFKADSKKVEKWLEKLGPKTRPRIGITWSSASNFKNDAKRSMQLSEFLKALPEVGYDYICLQKEIKEGDKATLETHENIHFFGEDLQGFGDTAALIECVDLVISTCTSVPHLSASLGKETWVLLSFIPDWRWLLDREDSPWYPSVKLFRQDQLNDWDGVLARVKANLEERLK